LLLVCRWCVKSLLRVCFAENHIFKVFGCRFLHCRQNMRINISSSQKAETFASCFYTGSRWNHSLLN